MKSTSIAEARRLGLLPSADAKVQGEPRGSAWGQIGLLTLQLPKLDRATHCNSRHHWAKKANATAKQKAEAKTLAMHTMIGKPWKAATVQVTYYTTAARCDRDNVLSWCKSSFDGLQGVVIADDSGFTYLPVQIERVKRSDPHCGRVRLTITRTA